ncbi:hypothetical protein O3M35_002275 [Rhynocoris fuscipes]|uniref:Carbonic anhydrase n=1 Tax=Rhynocoris fuscipes TaxID=488301 RepID=A0AAW1CUM4_9HEMI
MLSIGPILVLLLISTLRIADGTHTSSFKDGICDSGEEQSPIDIETRGVIEIQNAQPIVFINYEHTNLTASLGSHTVKLTPSHDKSAGLGAGGIRNYYVLDSIHFHWGSEHTIDGERFPLEAHFVHYNSLYYPNIEKAFSDPGGLAVVAVLFRQGDPNNAIESLKSAIDRLLDGRNRDGHTSLHPDALLPKDTSAFYRYHGSLTTPPCTESVIWTVIQAPLSVSSSQVAWFQSLSLADGKHHSSNYRPVQPLNGRYVELHLPIYTNNAFIQHPCINLLLIILLIVFEI